MKSIKYYTASWCGPCKMIRPIIEELIKEGYNILIKDVDSNTEDATEDNIRSVPTFIFYEDNTEINRKIGADISKSTLKNFF